MKQYFLFATIVLITIIISGCAGHQIDSKGTDELMARIDEDNEGQNERIRTIEAYIAKMDEKAMGPLEKQELINRVAVLETKMNDLERRSEISTEIPREDDIEKYDKNGRASIRIKVLSGDGSPTSAKRMAVRLERYGYKVERTDIATKRNLNKTKIFYSEGNRMHAAEIFRKIGGNADLKSLTWQSAFDIIIVTGGP